MFSHKCKLPFDLGELKYSEEKKDLYSSLYSSKELYIYIYAFSRRFYPKRLTVHSGYTFIVSVCVSWELNPQPIALLTQCSTTEPQEQL